uniref:Uncharacterized protein n=1 Tax=Anguilla anguilla TaxID=7936 RepID=A0A0E9PIN3_ANGAN
MNIYAPNNLLYEIICSRFLNQLYLPFLK